MKGLTITMKIDVDLEGIPPEKLGATMEDMHREARELKAEMEKDFKDDPEMAARVKVSVEVEEKV
jgi:hypothetical protein